MPLWVLCTGITLETDRDRYITLNLYNMLLKLHCYCTRPADRNICEGKLGLICPATLPTCMLDWYLVMAFSLSSLHISVI